MAPLTLTEKYNDLVRCADQPLSSYDKLTNEDLDDVIGKSWPFIIESITYTSLPISKIYTKLERRLKIQFQLYSEAAKRHQQKFPNRRPIRRIKDYTNTYLTDDRSLSFETTSTFSFDNASKINVPDFYVFCVPERSNSLPASLTKQQQRDFDRVIKYIMTTMQTSPYKMLIFKQVLKECCRCGDYYRLKNVCLAADTSIENIYFDNNDTVLHESIKLNNKQLATELIRYKFDINVDGELGTPLVTAIHYNILWAVEILLSNDADLTRRHIDWPFMTLYEYCIQFAKIDIKLIIDKYITSLIRKRKYTIIRKMVDNGWTMYLKNRRQMKY